MIQIIKDNKYYFSGLFLFLLLAFIGLLSTDQGAIILFFSENRTTFGDFFFKYFTKVGEEWAYISLFLGFLFYKIRYSLLIPIITILVFIVSFPLKAYFQHDRPHTFFSKQIKQKSNPHQLTQLKELNFIEDVDVHTGQTSFPSGHTTSGFALFGLLALLLPKKRGIALLCLSIAILIGISRIYLVQHFLKDVFLGAFLGSILALLLFYFQNRIPYDPSKWYDQSLFQKIKSKTPTKQV